MSPTKVGAAPVSAGTTPVPAPRTPLKKPKAFAHLTPNPAKRNPLANDTGSPYAEIPLTHGRVAIVDEADFEAVSVTEWRVVTGAPGLTDYAAGACEVKYMRMHRWLCGLTPGDGMTTHHINGNGLDNRRSNLLVMTRGDHRRGHNLGTLFPPRVYRSRASAVAP